MVATVPLSLGGRNKQDRGGATQTNRADDVTPLLKTDVSGRFHCRCASRWGCRVFASLRSSIGLQFREKRDRVNVQLLHVVEI